MRYGISDFIKDFLISPVNNKEIEEYCRGVMVATARNTKRPLNRCASCGKTWYPRGSNLSSRCPKCGSGKTKLAGLGIVGTLGALFLMLVMGGHPDRRNDASITPSNSGSIQSGSDTPSSAQLTDSAKAEDERALLAQGITDAPAGKPQTVTVPASTAESTANAPLVAAEVRDTPNAIRIGAASAPDGESGGSTFAHH
ncbi:hypothetical protein [Paraburkholderia fungorum]|uniref:hypothetical protein n=1 Tax=Paraburkholderia fungorum TaxID=134537 RepID=UPI0038BA9DB1